jgi:hypothetical protein
LIKLQLVHDRVATQRELTPAEAAAKIKSKLESFAYDNNLSLPEIPE